MVFRYSRANLSLPFTFISTTDTFSETRKNGFTVSSDGKVILSVQDKIPIKLRIYTCGVSVVSMIEPVNGKQAICQTAA